MMPEEEWAHRCTSVHPFALLVEPQRAVEASVRMAKLELPRSACRMLSRKAKTLSPELARFDQQIDQERDRFF